MGDRANICIQYGDADERRRVFFYSHWGGSDLPVVLQRALRRKQRWDDPPYLARIVFCEMVKGHEDKETGYVISPKICDNSDPILVVDTENKTICTVKIGRDDVDIPDGAEPLATFSYGDYCELDMEANGCWAAVGSDA
jgi:hypothetical protein